MGFNCIDIVPELREKAKGQVVLGFRHSGRMDECATVPQARHMKDRSMFKAIANLEKHDFLIVNPIVEEVSPA